ncbi:hypothetical protein NC652_034837 [Populus alba x Populus x berolinensis]|nr:hypothetical protein NC652_034837 [Populus alba x Populus x berolinensis]
MTVKSQALTLNEWNTYTLPKLPRNITNSSHILLPSPNSLPSSLDHFSLFFALDFIFSRGKIPAQPNKTFCNTEHGSGKDMT